MAINRSTFVSPNYTPDTLTELYDLSPSQLTQAQRFQTLKMKVNKSQLELTELNQLSLALRDYLITAERFNHFQDALVNMQFFIKNEVSDYVDTMQTEMATYADNKKIEYQAEINKFSFKGEYQPTTIYHNKNTVSYQGQSYICLSDNTINILPTSTSGWALIAKQGIQGIQGIKGDDGFDLVFKGRYDTAVTYSPQQAVEYNGSLYYCKSTVTGIAPNDASFWTLAVSRGASSSVRTFTNKVTLSANSSNVSIGIPEFNASQDALIVYVGYVYSHLGVNWRMNANLTSIDAIDYEWEAGMDIYFVVFKNMQADLVYTDGTMLENNTIADTKLMPDNKIGSLATLNTIDKSSVVGAVKEVNNKIGILSSEIDGLEAQITEVNGALAVHLSEMATLTKLGHVKANTDTEGMLVLPEPKLTIEKFDSAGTYQWTVPQGITKVYLSGCGGGGGGHDGSTGTTISAESGGITSFGSYLSLSGGGGGGTSYPGLPGGINGQYGGSEAVPNGGSSLFGSGGIDGKPFDANKFTGGDGQGFGSGGSGNGGGLGGGSGESVLDVGINVTPLELINITVGIGGVGKINSISKTGGGNGANGLLLIKYIK